MIIYYTVGLPASGKSTWARQWVLDTANRILGSYRPFKFQELQKIMANKDIKQEDSHDEKTNAQ